MAPKTLLQMAGAPAAPSKLSDAVLVVVDAQREYVDGKLPLSGVGQALAEIGKLLARARAAGTPVIHIQHKGKPAKVALMAALRKLLCRLNAMIRHDTDWLDQPVSAR